MNAITRWGVPIALIGIAAAVISYVKRTNAPTEVDIEMAALEAAIAVIKDDHAAAREQSSRACNSNRILQGIKDLMRDGSRSPLEVFDTELVIINPFPFISCSATLLLNDGSRWNVVYNTWSDHGHRFHSLSQCKPSEAKTASDGFCALFAPYSSPRKRTEVQPRYALMRSASSVS